MGSKFGYSAALDGFRACAVLIVMAIHIGVPLHGGLIGVNAFFVLSGFLITSLLLHEYGELGRIRLGAFFARRALRLYPPLVAMVAAVALYSLFVPGAIRGDESISSVPAVLLYFSNWVRGLGEGAPLGLFEHSWSLSIEEQFYLIWPLLLVVVLRLTGRIGAVAAVALTGCAGALLLRLTLNGAVPGQRISNGIDTQADQLLFGCALAVFVLIARRREWERPARLLRFAASPTAILLAVLVCFWKTAETTIDMVIPVIVAVACAILIGCLYLNPATILARTLSTRPMVYVGKRSYALYLWHYPIFTVMAVSGFPSNSMLRIALELGLSFIAAELSWRLVEAPALKLKARFSSATTLRAKARRAEVGPNA